MRTSASSTRCRCCSATGPTTWCSTWVAARPLFDRARARSAGQLPLFTRGFLNTRLVARARARLAARRCPLETDSPPTHTNTCAHHARHAPGAAPPPPLSHTHARAGRHPGHLVSPPLTHTHNTHTHNTHTHTTHRNNTHTHIHTHTHTNKQTHTNTHNTHTHTQHAHTHTAHTRRTTSRAPRRPRWRASTARCACWACRTRTWQSSAWCAWGRGRPAWGWCRFYARVGGGGVFWGGAWPLAHVRVGAGGLRALCGLRRPPG